MKMSIILCLLAAIILIAGCTSPGQSTGASAYGNPSTSNSFAAVTNNSTSSVYALGAVMSKHAISYIFSGTGWTSNRTDVALQGSIDNLTFSTLVNATGNSNGTSFVTDKPVLYVRVVTSLWNATANNSTVAAVTVNYVGTS